MITFSHVDFAYEKEAPTLLDINFSLPEKDFVTIVGRSGAGKSTILKLIANIIKPTKGELKIDGSVSMVFQNGALLPWLSLYENVSLPLTVAQKAHANETIESSLKKVGLWEYKDKYPREVSGGQRQRAGIARAIAMDPQILLLDEPFSALDTETARELRDDLLTIWETHNITMVMVSHSVEDAVLLGKKIFILHPDTHHTTEIQNTIPYPRSGTQNEVVAKIEEVKKNL